MLHVCLIILVECICLLSSNDGGVGELAAGGPSEAHHSAEMPLCRDFVAMQVRLQAPPGLVIYAPRG